MTKLISRTTVVITALGALLPWGPLGATAGIASAQDHAQIERGTKVYADQKCALCHAIDGKRNAKGKLDGVGSRLQGDEIREWIINPVEMAQKTKIERKPAMKASTASKEDVDALVAYIVSLK